MKAYMLLMIFFTAVVLAENKMPVNDLKESDEISTAQSSTTTGHGLLGKKSCIVINSTRERICNKRAEKWCNKHNGAKECRKFQNIDASKP